MRPLALIVSTVAVAALIAPAATSSELLPNRALPSDDATASMAGCGSMSPAIQVHTPRPGVQIIPVSVSTYVERLTGEAAWAHLYNVMSRHPDAFAEARKRLRDRGFAPTEHVYVERTIRFASQNSSGDDSVIRFAQDYSESNSDGEIAFWSWDDGDDSTWEGSIYVEIYGNGDASTWEGQIDASTEEHPWIYYEKTWEKPGIGDDDPWKAFYDVTPRLRTPAPIVLLANADLSSSTVAPAAYGTNSLRNARSPFVLAGDGPDGGWLGWAKRWRKCVVSRCIGAAVGCLWTGASWPGCFGGFCTGMQVSCAIEAY